MKKAGNALFVLVAISSMRCGSPSQSVVAPTAVEATVTASLDAMDYMPADSSAILGADWNSIVKSGFFQEQHEPFSFLNDIRGFLLEECQLALDTDLQSVVVAFSSATEITPTTFAIETKIARAKLEKCIETLRVGDDARSENWQTYWPSDSMVILSTEHTTGELQALGMSERKLRDGIAAQMESIDRDAPLWVAMDIPSELIEAASLPLSPTFLSANIRLSENSTSELFLQFSDSFGVDSALELFTLMKAPALTRLGLDNNTVFDAKKVGSDLQLTVGTNVLSSTYRELKAMADDEERHAQTPPGDIPAPDDVAAPPAGAAKTAKGVYYKMLSTTSKNALNRKTPKAHDTVTVHYTGWTTDGKMFDSSRTRGKTAEFPLDRVIEGWTDGLQQMAIGEVFRFWIPENLAYKGRSGAPKGMLVFDVELLGIKQPPTVPDDLMRAPRTALKTRRGIKYKFLKHGTGGQRPKAWDKVTAHYSGWTQDGKMFDSSRMRSRPATFPLTGLIPGWTEVMQKLQVGDSVRVWIPQKYAYKGMSGKPKGLLVFDIELIEVEHMPKAPRNVKRAPKNAKRTALGTRYKVLKKGTGASPGPSDKVEVHYTGWTTDGKMFDSSLTRKRTATFPLTAVIPGWTDGLQTMAEGGKTRFWIPEKLAYKGRPGKPAGTLVFDVELISVLPTP